MTLLEKLEHFRLNIDTQHASLRTHHLGNLQGIEAVATTHIANGHAGFEA